MKKLFTILSVMLLTATIWAESPEKISYQAVVRDTKGELVANQAIGMKISIYYYNRTFADIVYSETQTPTSNVYGLVSVSIGAGTVVKGVFADLEWAARHYYLKTEIDPEGGTNYTISGTSQLLSVPYALHAKNALHAKTAETLTGTSGTAHYVGELYGGGVVFWVDQTGNHGLICSMLNTELTFWTGTWYQLITVPGGAKSDWDGQANTAAINAQAGENAGPFYAAGLCDAYTNEDYGTGVYSDWYLPSICELNLLWNNLYQVQKALDSDGNETTTAISKTFYWSSSEYSGSDALMLYFLYGTVVVETKKGFPGYPARAVRAF